MDRYDRLIQNVLVTGPRVVTAAHPAASAAGVAAYAQGGNAFDAALAACFMETIALPMKCGLAGDLVALFRRNGGAFETIVSIGPSAQALARGEKLELLGPRSVGVPGAPHGYALLHRFARLALDRLAKSAIRAAEDGIAWTWAALSYLIESDDLLARYSPGHPYCPGGRRPQVGDMRRLPGLGNLLRQFAAREGDVFGGEEGVRLVSELQSRGGFLSVDDVRQPTAQIVAPVAFAPSGGTRLLVTPGPTAGPRLGRVVTRARPGGKALPVIVRSEREEAKQHGRQATDGGTSVVTAADDEGNVAVVLHSNSFPRFGSGVVLESGLVLNNRPGRGFDLSAPVGARNAPAAGRIPQTTLHAWALETEDALFVGATPGGVNQLPWNAQAIGDLLDGADIRAAVTSPRWALDERDELTAEEGTQIAADIAVGRWVDRFAHRSVQQIIRIDRRGMLSAAADPRSGACALAVY
jgi:gamma-glutamyltranspeptidase/glutathione hydrolase